MSQKRFTLIFKILTVVFAITTTIVVTAASIMLENSSEMSSFFNARTSIVYELDDAEEQDTTYYNTVYSSVAEELENSYQVSRDVIAEGCALVKNDNNVLPLAKGSKVNLYSASSTDIVTSGGGSSSSSAPTYDLQDSFGDDDINLEINQDLYSWYESSAYGRVQGSGVGGQNTINEAPWSAIPETYREASADVGIFVLTRSGSENADVDLHGDDEADMTNGLYLTLSPAEITVLEGMKALKGTAFSEIVMIMNTPTNIELSFLDEEKYGIDAALWTGTLGTMGAYAVGDLLVGNVNPSGKLSDTGWANHRYNPVLSNFDDYVFDGELTTPVNGSTDPEEFALFDGSSYYIRYVVYQEGIYVGYRYTETRYEDLVLGKDNVGTYNYSDVVTYPFGYGLSYTTFEYSNYTCEFNSANDSYDISVDVKNTGKVAGKEAVQIYLQKPYTAYDKTNSIEKASVELVGFGKTDTLAAGATETVNITVDRYDFASYDAHGAKTYILDEGDYYLTAAKDSHDAVNNILAEKKADGVSITDSEIVVLENNSGDNGASLTEKFTFDFGGDIDDTTYSQTTEAMESGLASEAKDVTNQFDYGDLNIYENSGDNSVEYISRSDWSGTVTYGIADNLNNEILNNEVVVTLNKDLETDLKAETFFTCEESDMEYPTYKSTETNYTLILLREYEDGTKIPFDDPLWDELLDQLSWEETTSFLMCGARMTSAIDSIAKPQTIDHNGAVGVNQAYNVSSSVNRGFAVSTDDPNKSSRAPSYPCNGIASSTFNVELMAEYGDAWGEDCLWAGYAGLYGPGLNMHRSPYAGRNFEYYSEDSFLAGRICGTMCAGIEGKGVYVYLKHPLLNDQEMNRSGLSTWANEQSIRELYLKPVKMAIEEGGARNIMIGLNKVGAFWNQTTGFIDDVLRDECGMSGFAVTDWLQDNGQADMMPVSHLYGTDLVDRDFSTYSYYDKFSTNHGDVAWAMRDSVHRILYTVVHSAGMNGISASTRVISITPDWNYYINLGVSVSITLLIGCAVILLTCYVPKIVSLITGKKSDGEEPNEQEG